MHMLNRFPLRVLLVSLVLTVSSPSFADTGSRLIATGGVSSFEGTAGGGITPWALIGGYSSREEIQGSANIQLLDTDEYQLTTLGLGLSLYDRFEITYQRQSLSVSSGVVSNTFNLLTDGAISTAPSTDIEQDIVGVKAKLFGDAVYSDKPWLPQVAAGLQYKKNRDFDSSIAISDGSTPLPGVGVPQLLGATEDSGTDIYLSATKLWLAGAFGQNLLANVTARYTKANTFGLLGFESATDDGYELEWEGSLVLLPSNNTAIGFEWRTQSDRLGSLAEEKTVTDVFVAYFPSKAWSVTAAYVDLGNLPFDSDAKALYLTITANI